MRGLILLLPVLLVLFLAGNARTEKESSSVADADLPSNLLPLSEKVGVREARSAGKGNGEKKKKKKKTNLKKKKANTDKRKRKRKTENGGETKKKNKKKNKKPSVGRKKKRNRNGKAKKDSQKNTGDKKKNKNKNKKKEKKKEKKRKRKMKERRRKNRNRGGNSAGRQAAGGDWSSCGTTGVNDTCLINAVSALNFEKGQIQNFFKRKARLENQAKVTGNKKGKKGEFEDAAGYMLTAIGGNISNPTCGDNSSRTQRGADSAVETYKILINCSATIHEACDMPNGTVNETFLAGCAKIYNLSKTASDDCRSNTAYTSDGAAACNCWEKAAIGIKIAKEEGCTSYGQKTAKAVTAQKKKCVTAFSKCKSAEDSAVKLIHTCMSGEVNTNASSAEKELTGRLWV